MDFRRGFAALSIFGISVLAFCRCFDYGLIDLDDYSFILSHPDVVGFAGWKSIVYYFTDVSECIWMPLTWISYALDHALFGRWFGGYHIHSVLVHAVNAVLVYRLLVLLLAPTVQYRQPTTLCCLVAALVWAIHPLRCESVVFLASRKDVLSFFWELLALLAWVRGSRCEALTRRALLTSVSVVFFVVGAMCKPSVMTFPLLCLLLDVFVIRRVRPLRYIVPVVLMLGLGGFAVWQQSVGGAMASGANEPLSARIAIAAAAFGIYLRNTVLPFWLAAQCVKQWPAWPRFLVPGIVLSLLWGGFLLRRGWRYWTARRETVAVERLDGCPVCLTFGFSTDCVFAGMAWFALSVAPMLGLAPFGYHAFADRFTYIPAFGLSLLLAAGLDAGVRRFGLATAAMASAVGIAALAAGTWWQTGFWRDDLTLFSRTVEVDGDGNFFAHYALGLHFFEVTHDLEKARFHFEMARKAQDASLDDSIALYVMTLVESGREDEIPELMRTFQDSLVRRYGEAKAQEILWGGPTLDRHDTRVSMLYRFSRIAAMLGERPALGEALKELDALRDSQGGASIWRYLMWRALVKSGDTAAADAMRECLVDPLQASDYLQFKFLRR